MAEHKKLNSTDVTPLTRDEGHSHDVADVARHLRATDGSKGSSVPQPLQHLANPEHDVESHFSSKSQQAHKGAEIAKEK